jgi:LuxR family maltose regulon positive regulatory protein
LVAFFIEHLPETVHLVLSTRYNVPLSLGRLRARCGVNEIRAEQLAFSEKEAASLLRDRLHLDVDHSELRILLDRTEGWPAGISLAALSLGGTKDTQAFIQSFRGSNRFIVEILGEEVLGNLSGEERDFVLRTSILQRMSASLCEAITGMKNSGRLLRELERSNLFIVSLDEQGEWYRYHKLFSEFLRYELRSTQPELVPVLHGRASEWFEQAGLIEAAISHALAAKEYGRVGLLIAGHWFGYAASGQMATVERWLDALPEDFIDRDAALSLVRAWLSALQGRPEESERFLALAQGCTYEGELPDGSASVEADVALVRGVFGYGGVQRMLAAARRAQELAPPEQTSPWAALEDARSGSSTHACWPARLAKRCAVLPVADVQRGGALGGGRIAGSRGVRDSKDVRDGEDTSV